MLILFQREKFSGARALVGSLGQLFFDDYDEHKHTEEYDEDFGDARARYHNIMGNNRILHMISDNSK